MVVNIVTRIPAINKENQPVATTGSVTSENATNQPGSPGLTDQPAADSTGDIGLKENNGAASKAAAAAAIPVEDPPYKIKWSTGLQWNLPIAFQGPAVYFAGPSAKSQPFRLLFPALWFGVEEEKQSMVFTIHPFATGISNAGVVKQTDYWVDSLTLKSEKENLTKTFGFSFEFDYARKLQGKWWAGVGIRGSIWKKALVKKEVVTSTGAYVSDPSPVKQSETVLSPLDDYGKQNMNTIQVGPVMQVIYQKPSWQSGFQLHYALPSLVKESNQNGLRAEIFMRLPILKRGR